MRQTSAGGASHRRSPRPRASSRSTNAKNGRSACRYVSEVEMETWDLASLAKTVRGRWRRSSPSNTRTGWPWSTAAGLSANRYAPPFMAPHRVPIVCSRRTSWGRRAVAVSDVAPSRSTYALVAHRQDPRLFAEDLRFCLWPLQTGNLGSDPEVRAFGDHQKVTRLSVATHEV